MLKKSLIVFFFIFLSGCVHSTSSLLGPAFTGATSKSITQTTLSFGSNQIVRKIRETSKKSNNEIMKIAKKFDDFDLEIKSKDFYVSVKNLYSKDQQKKRKLFFSTDR